MKFSNARESIVAIDPVVARRQHAEQKMFARK
jgi:hypothetical protein